jgi:hypothetical protein
MVDDKDTMQPVRCLIVPADPGFLVIPSAAVAEIVPLIRQMKVVDLEL